MTQSNLPQPNADLDLVLERVVAVAPDVVWKAWTEPKHLMKWFTPAPWKTVDCEIDLRPGGTFRTVMQSPEGEDFPQNGCYLEVVPNEKLVWTNALEPGFRPSKDFGAPNCPILFTAFISLVREGTGTKYQALVVHGDPKMRAQHEQMGFHDGWGAALDQLVAAAPDIR